MKHLNTFESHNRPHIPQEELDKHLDEIKSAFIEYIDEFDIELIPDDLDLDDDSQPGIYYNLYWSWHDTRRKKIGFEFSIYLYWNDKRTKKIFVDKFFEFYSKLEYVKSHLKSMGYEMRYDGLNVKEFSEDPDEFCIKISYWL
jgi:hypothetical protein